jgi:hypothetical protein
MFAALLTRSWNRACLISLSPPDITVDAMGSSCSAWTQDGVLRLQVLNRLCICKV